MQTAGPKGFDNDDAAYAGQSLHSFRAQFDMGRFTSNCSSAGVRILYRNVAELESLTQCIVEKVRNREPSSLLRIRDGEGNVLSLALPGSLPERDLRFLNAIFRIEDGRSVGSEQARSLSTALLKALEEADIIGTRLFRPLDEEGAWNEANCATSALAKGDIRGCLGMIRAVETLEQLLAGRPLKLDVLTSAWIYVHLLADLDRILEHAERVVVISGRPALKNIFAAKCRGKQLRFIGIPVESIGGRAMKQPSHYPDYYNGVISFLKQDKNIQDSLILVGADRPPTSGPS